MKTINIQRIKIQTMGLVGITKELSQILILGAMAFESNTLGVVSGNVDHDVMSCRLLIELDEMNPHISEGTINDANTMTGEEYRHGRYETYVARFNP